MQLYSALLYNANINGFVRGSIYTGSGKKACVPGLNCYSCPGAIGSCPLGALQNSLSSSYGSGIAYVAGTLLMLGILLGRTICGWLCPFGLIQELLHKIPTKKIRKSRVTRLLSLTKYAVLAAFVIAIPLWYRIAKGLPVPGFCKYICPAGTLQGSVPLLLHPGNANLKKVLGGLFVNKVTILVLVLTASVFCRRAFCRFLCPLGAIYGLSSRIALVGVKVDEKRCTGCKRCVSACPMDIRKVGDRECVHCTACMRVCGEKAISMKAGKITLMQPANTKKEDDSVRNVL